MKRNTPLRANPDKILAWQQRSKPMARGKQINRRSEKRGRQEEFYSMVHRKFLSEHPVCPITLGETTQIHHSAKREGRWLNIQRYWIAVSAEGHEAIEGKKRQAAEFGLMVRINQTAEEHIQKLIEKGESVHDPIFYKNWDGSQIFLE